MTEYYFCAECGSLLTYHDTDKGMCHNCNGDITEAGKVIVGLFSEQEGQKLLKAWGLTS